MNILLQFRNYLNNYHRKNGDIKSTLLAIISINLLERSLNSADSQLHFPYYHAKQLYYKCVLADI